MRSKKDKKIIILALIIVVLAALVGVVSYILVEKGIIPEEISYKVGVFAGVLFGGAFIIAILLLAKKKNVTSNEFDERQKLTKGVAAQRAFEVMALLLFAMMMLEVAEITLPIERPVQYLLVIFIGAIVMICYNIWHDAYFSLNESKPFIIVLLAVMAAINGIIGSINLMSGKAIVDGVLTIESVNLIVAVFFVVVLALIAVKYLCERQGDDEE